MNKDNLLNFCNNDFYVDDDKTFDNGSIELFSNNFSNYPNESNSEYYNKSEGIINNNNNVHEDNYNKKFFSSNNQINSDITCSPFDDNILPSYDEDKNEMNMISGRNSENNDWNDDFMNDTSFPFNPSNNPSTDGKMSIDEKDQLEKEENEFNQFIQSCPFTRFINDSELFHQIIQSQSFSMNNCQNYRPFDETKSDVYDINFTIPFHLKYFQNMKSSFHQNEPKWEIDLMFYEGKNHTGETFTTKKWQITIDGYCGENLPNSSRYSLGSLIFGNRNILHDKTRLAVGKGIVISRINYRYYITVLSAQSIFIEAPFMSLCYKGNLGTIFKIPSNKRFCIFDIYLFNYFINESSLRYSYKELIQLNKLCYIRISFIKGWGNDYPRKEISSTPCWLQLQLNHSLKELDNHVSTNQTQNKSISIVSS
ncbi:hypothetical protein SNEBB_006495 [Seison nebaliae]|nr:hypothetical protein SNEBB_006495 [Seison nebaliae]